MPKIVRIDSDGFILREGDLCVATYYEFGNIQGIVKYDSKSCSYVVVDRTGFPVRLGLADKVVRL